MSDHKCASPVPDMEIILFGLSGTTLLPNPEIEYLYALGLFDSPEIAETIPLLKAKREYLEALEILEPIPQFHQTNIISSGCELLDDYYQVEIEKESIYAQDPINTLGVLREQIINIFNNHFDLTHGFKTQLYLKGKMKDNSEIDYKEVLFKNKAVVITAKENIPRIVDELIWDNENQIETYVVNSSGWVYEILEEVNIEMPIYVPLTAKDLYLALYHQEQPQNQNPYLGELNFNGIQFSVKADNNTIEKLLLITGDDPKIGELALHYCLIQGRDGHQTHDPKIDAQHMEDCERINTPVQRTRYEQMLDAPFTCTADAETLSTLIEKNQGSKTIAIQEYKVILFDYIIRCSNSKSKVLVKIRGNDPAREFIKAIEKEAEKCQDFFAGGKINLNLSKEYKKLLCLKHYLKGLYLAHRKDALGVDIGIIYHLANTIYYKFDAHLISQAMGQVSKEKISTIPHNIENYLSLDIRNQRYMNSLQLIPGFLDSYISNLEAEPCKEKVDKDRKSLNLLYKKPDHLYRINSNRCFAYPERFSTTREYEPKERDDLIIPEETPDLFNKISKCKIPDDADKDYILEVDIDYSYKLYKAHTLYSLAPKNIEISKEKMSKYRQEIINNLRHYTKTKKLVSNLNNKKKYIVYYQALQFYIKQEMLLTKIHRAIEFNQSPWMKPFIEKLARSRALAKNDFEKNMYKLLERESKKFKKLVADPSYKSYRILAENLVGISCHQSKARLSKPIFIGMTVLDENNVEVVYTDTDLLILLIQIANVYKDMAEMHKHFDLSNYKPEHSIYKALRKEKISLNKKVPGKFKNESCDHRSKGVQKVVVKKNLTNDMYEDCLKS
ncbi:35483_t:CDS:10 [Gigaspora margarita]|uniref:35483_t:CDS:1 n=1 Tax=Gigaspora margarita TaxID=4874 RepID=A0ABM8VVW2_GIGMA|nr:35483_t:CDS:10 [Gigaspora margarita]